MTERKLGDFPAESHKAKEPKQTAHEEDNGLNKQGHQQRQVETMDRLTKTSSPDQGTPTETLLNKPYTLLVHPDPEIQWQDDLKQYQDDEKQWSHKEKACVELFKSEIGVLLEGFTFTSSPFEGFALSVVGRKERTAPSRTEPWYSRFNRRKRRRQCPKL